MSQRIDGRLSTQLNPFGPQWPTAKQSSEAQSVGAQVKQALFGRPRPVLLDPAQFPQLAEAMRLLHRYKRKLAHMAGDSEQDYDLALADGTIAAIDEEGTVFVGAQFLQSARHDEALLVGVLAHEIGHQPKRWDAYRQQRPLTREELWELCRHEETRADMFAGKALAEMGLSCEAMVRFLEAIEQGPHPEYFPAKVRAEIIRQAHAGRTYGAEARRKLFPELNRATSPKDHLGEF